ncbi:SMI1/KNR4 family protein [Nonomuraea sp. CA-143628]|uniref:SMI1/KNR4 family protein n=1 Tax=Nonomuraea sp. CA-143628 TaxID=3239997 RepID=UPI003D8AF61E
MAYDPAPLEQLTTLVPPPPSPVFGIRAWDEVFADIGMRLPDDYVAFIERYGSCDFARWLYVCDIRLLTKEQCAALPEEMDDYRDLREDSPEDFTLAMWPEPGGFFSWGSTVNGDAIGWLTVGEPEVWPAIIVPHEAEQEPPIAETMTEWLVGWASGARYDTSGFAEGVEGHPLVCEPLS